MDNILARIDEIKDKAPKPKWRAAHGRWVDPAWVVRGLVERHGFGVTDAVRTVVAQEGHSPADRAEKSIRQAYYQLRKKPWPQDLEEA